MGLLQARARVTVVAPQATAGVQHLGKSGEIIWHKRKFTTRDLEGVVLVVAATSSPQTNAVICREARRRGVLCNAVDDPANCDFYYPAVVRRGSLQIAISTAGASPELAARLRRELESCFGPEYGPWVDDLRRRRVELLCAPLPAAKRRRLLRQLASRQAFEQFLRKTSKKAPRFKR
jgi:precorrin-2 dehydrogenase/sirohydrochlorin ferrochelatase